MLRRVTQPSFIAGPLPQISRNDCSASRIASNKIHRDEIPTPIYHVCNTTRLWDPYTTISGDSTSCLDNDRRQPQKAANAHIKNWLRATFC